MLRQGIGIGDRHAADFPGNGGRQPLQIGLFLEMMQHELIGKAVVDDRTVRPVDQQIDLFRGNRRGHQFSFPSALSCQRRNIRCDTTARHIEMTMPATESNNSAANMRGMLSR